MTPNTLVRLALGVVFAIGAGLAALAVTEPAPNTAASAGRGAG